MASHQKDESPRFQKVGEIIKPLVTEDQAQELASQLYTLHNSKAKELVSYDDRNFIMQCCCEPSRNCNCNNKIHIMKVANIIDSENSERLELQNEIMLHLSSRGLLVQRPIQSVNGNYIEGAEFFTPVDNTGSYTNRKHAVRLLSFLPGSTLLAHDILTSNICFQAGTALANLHHHLKSLPTDNPTMFEEPLWSLTNATSALEFLDVIEGVDRRHLACDVLSTFQASLMPRLRGASEHWKRGVEDLEFPVALIHGDPNEQNLLVIPNNTGEGGFKIGFLDWQDSCVSRRIYDLAILIMSVCCCQVRPGDSIKDLGVACIRGFNEAAKATGWLGLTSAELDALPTLVAARLTVSLVMGEYSYRVATPGNVYALFTAENGCWDKLDMIWIRQSAEFRKAWSKQVM